MLLNEQRLRELYAAGEITQDELERGLAVAMRRAETPLRSKPAPADPLPRPQRARPAAQLCPHCQGNLRAVHELGVDTHWCANCQAYIGIDPRTIHHGATGPGASGAIIALGYVDEPDGWDYGAFG